MKAKFLTLLSFLLSFGVTAQDLTNKGDTITIKNGTLLFVGGDLTTLTNGGLYPVMDNSGILRVNGNITYSTNTISIGQDSMLLSGTGPQSFPGANYWYLASTGNGTKTLTGNANVKTKVEVLAGTIDTDTNLIIMDSLATLTETATNNVVGFVRQTRKLLQNVNYTAGGMGVEIKAINGAPGVTMITRRTGTSAIQTGNGNQGITRYFDIAPTNNTGLNATLVFHYYDGELNSITESNLALFKSADTGTTWTYMGYGSRDATLNTVTQSALNDFSRWTLGSSVAPLPVELLSFDAWLQGSDGILKWVTASELNNDHFDIERSLDATHWTKIGEQAGFGTTTLQHIYNYKDNNITLLLSPIIYYRLKQVDYNGDYTYSNVEQIKLEDASTKNEIKAWYNGNDGNAWMNFNLTAKEKMTIRLSDANGKTISQQIMNLEQGVTQARFDMNNLATGVYNLNFSGEHTKEVKRLMKN